MSSRRNTKKLLSCLIFTAGILTLFIKTAFSQTINYNNYGVLDGLANSTTYSSIQDSKGFIWIATTSGVNRFNGKTFETFTTDDGLADNEVLGLMEDSKGRIWFLNFNGRLGYYYNDQFYNPENDPLLHSAVTQASILNGFEDSSNRLWFSTNQQQIIKIDDNRITVYAKPNKAVDISNTFIFEDDQKRIIAANTKGFYLLSEDRIEILPARFLVSYLKSFSYNKRTRELQFLSADGLIAYQSGRFKLIRNIPEGIPATEFGSFIVSKNDLWITSLKGGVWVAKDGDNAPQHYLDDHIITHIMKDRDGNIWLPTIGNGLTVLPAYTENVRHYTPLSGLTEQAVYSVFKDKSDRIWVGLKSGILNLIEGKKVTRIDLNQTPSNFNPIKKLVFDAKNNSVWFASSTAIGEISVANPLGKIRHLKEKNKLSFSMKSFSISEKGKLAFSLASGVYELDSKDGDLVFETAVNLANQKYFPDRSFKVLYDSKERLWFSNVKGLFRYANGKVDTLSKINNILAKRVTDMIELPDGNMVIGTYGFGIVILKPDNTASIISSKNGLNSNICRRLAFDGKYLWLTTFSGVDRLEYKVKGAKTKTFRIKDGLTSNEVQDIYIDEKDIFLATNDGLTVLKRNEADIEFSPPLFYITNLTVNGKAHHHRQIPQLLYNQNNISVEFTAINFSQSEESYQYRLKDDAPWVETKNNKIEFGSLEPGSYSLSIRARIQGSAWSKIANASFLIRPAYWQRWWFSAILYFIISVVIIWLIYLFFKKQREREKEKLSIQTKIIALEQQALQAMMNPHFVFNIMNSIQYFINTQDSHSANEVLTGFARLIRKNLEICTKTSISLEEELVYLKLYLSLEKLRFGDKMAYEIQVADDIDTDDIMIPPMLLQPFVENAIWHGLMPQETGGTITIKIKADVSELIVEITDDGTGIVNSMRSKNPNHISRGTQITKDRVSLLNANHAGNQISIHSRQMGDSGTCVLVKIPV